MCETAAVEVMRGPDVANPANFLAPVVHQVECVALLRGLPGELSGEDALIRGSGGFGGPVALPAGENGGGKSEDEDE